jgi:hypothetical protein
MKGLLSKCAFVVAVVVIASLQALNPPSPPQNFWGNIKHEKHLKVTKILSWHKSQDPNVVGYKLYRNGVMIANIPHGAVPKFADQGRRQESKDTYTIFAYDRAGVKSKTLTVVIPLV